MVPSFALKIDLGNCQKAFFLEPFSLFFQIQVLDVMCHVWNRDETPWLCMTLLEIGIEAKECVNCAVFTPAYRSILQVIRISFIHVHSMQSVDKLLPAPVGIHEAMILLYEKD